MRNSVIRLNNIFFNLKQKEAYMPYRNQSMIRRGINRLHETLRRNKDAYPALAAILALVTEHRNSVNETWQNYQGSAVSGDKERLERDTAVDILMSWIQEWRPVTFMLVPGASQNVHTLPAGGTTTDDVIRVADDLSKFIKTNEAAAQFRESALSQLGDKLKNARKENRDAAGALPNETAARDLYSEACEAANTVLVKGSEVVRSIFGHTSPEYKQFITRNTNEEEEEITSESTVGED